MQKPGLENGLIDYSLPSPEMLIKQIRGISTALAVFLEKNHNIFVIISKML
jgi:hypothetical protein